MKSRFPAMLASIVIACFTLTAQSLSARKDSVELLVAEIRAELPVGWSVSFEPEYSFLSITKDQEIECRTMLPNISPDEKPEMAKYSFSFRVRPRISADEHARLVRENQSISKEMSSLYNQLIARGVSHKFDSFLPDNDDDRELVSRYEILKKQLHNLPDFYFGEQSLSWANGEPGKETILPANPKAEEECETVKTNVISVFTSY